MGIEPRHGGKADTLVELGPRRAGEDFNAVAKSNQLARQVAGVDALAPATRGATVDQRGNAHLSGPGGARFDSFGHGDRAAQRSRRLSGGDSVGNRASDQP